MLRKEVPRRAFRTEQELNNSITSIFSNQVTFRDTEEITLKAYVIVNGYQVKVLFDTSTMGDYVITGKFVSTNQIATENLKVPISLRMALKGFRSTINYVV
jgi:hypothetical protein